MGIQKFKSFEDAERALWCFKPDAAYYKRVAELWEMANRLCPPNFPRGIFKYKTIEEANKDKEKWIMENALKKRAKKTAKERER